MPLDWASLRFEEQAQAILDDIEGLDDAEIRAVFNAWKSLGYGPAEEEWGLTELTRMALDAIARKHGAPTSEDRALASLRRRGVIE